MNKFCVILLCFPALLFGQQTIIKEIDIKPYMYTQNYEHFKRLVLDSPNSKAEYVDGFILNYYSYKINLLDVPTARKLHKKPVPLIGGIVIGLSLIISVYLFDFKDPYFNIILTFSIINYN